MTGSDYMAQYKRTAKVDKDLLKLCNMCGITISTGLMDVLEVVEAHGMAVAKAVAKRLSMEVRDYTKDPIDQYMEILKAKLS